MYVRRLRVRYRELPEVTVFDGRFEPVGSFEHFHLRIRALPLTSDNNFRRWVNQHDVF
jgi:hypothetical protein